MTKIRENGATSGVGVLATYAFDAAGRRSSVTFGNGSVQSFGYDAASRLDTLTNNLGGAATTHDLAQTFSYNPASQIASVSRSNDAYAWQAHYNVDRSYTIDGLYRIMAVGSTAFTYDGRGNLTSDGTNSFTYTSENLLKTGPGGTTLAYDPLGRLYETAKSPTTTRFLYDGADRIGEYDGSNAVQRRYVHGPDIDNPIAWYEGSGIDSTTRRFLMADERGSVVSITDSAGATVHINAYDEYGIPAPGNVGKFGYTGQLWLPEIGMWYYKARIYSPTLGRFMQTDPIGYADGMNWYNYVGSDPVNFVDPSGLGRICNEDNSHCKDDGIDEIPVFGCSLGIGCQLLDLTFDFGLSDVFWERCAEPRIDCRNPDEILFDGIVDIIDEGKGKFCKFANDIGSVGMRLGKDSYRGAGASVALGLGFDISSGSFGINGKAGLGVGAGEAGGVSYGYSSPSSGSVSLNLGVEAGYTVAGKLAGSVGRNLIGTDPGGYSVSGRRVTKGNVAFANVNVNGGFNTPPLYDCKNR